MRSRHQRAYNVDMGQGGQVVDRHALFLQRLDQVCILHSRSKSHLLPLDIDLNVFEVLHGDLGAICIRNVAPTVTCTDDLDVSRAFIGDYRLDLLHSRRTLKTLRRELDRACPIPSPVCFNFLSRCCRISQQA